MSRPGWQARLRGFWLEHPNAYDLSAAALGRWWRILDGTDDPVVRQRVEAAGEALLAELDRYERTPDPQPEDFPLLWRR
jgi:hypothetical protein